MSEIAKSQFRSKIIRVVVLALIASTFFVGGSSRDAYAVPGDISTFAGTQKPTGTATDIDMGPLSLEFPTSGGNTLYVVDSIFNVVRTLDISTPTETVTNTVVVGNGARGNQPNSPVTTSTTTPLDVAARTTADPAVAITTGPSSGVAIDGTGAIYFAETGNHRVRKVAGTSVSSLAGQSSGAPGSSPDGSYPAGTALPMDNPSGVAVEAAGTLYVSDTGNDCVRKIVQGIAGLRTVTTVAGQDIGGGSVNCDAGIISKPAGLALDEGGGFLYIAEFGDNRVSRVETDGDNRDDPTDIVTGLNGPMGVAFSAGVLYVADTGNDRVLKVESPGAGNTVTVLATDLDDPRDVAVAGNGDVYVADHGGRRVRRIASGVGNTVGGDDTPPFRGDGATGTVGQLAVPMGVAIGGDGDVYVADTVNNKIRHVQLFDGVISTAVGTGARGYSGDGGPATAATLNSPGAVAFDYSGNMYIADTGNNVIRKVTRDGIISTVAGSSISGNEGDGGSAISARLNAPMGVAVDLAFNVYIADTGNNRIRVVRGGTIFHYAGDASGVAGGDFSATTVTASTSGLAGPRGVAMDSSGNLFVADTDNSAVRKITQSNQMVQVAGNGTPGHIDSPTGVTPPTVAALEHPTGVSVDSSGRVYIADKDNHKVRRVHVTGTMFTIAGTGSGTKDDAGFTGDGGASTSAKLSFPHAVVVTCDEQVFIADMGNNRIRKIQGPASVQPGGYWADAFGGVHRFGPAPAISENPRWPFPIARGIAMLADQSGGYVLDGFGGLHPFSTAAATNTAVPPPLVLGDYFPGNDIARGVVLVPTSTRVAVSGYWLDGFGGVHPFANQGVTPNPVVDRPAFNFDIARAITILKDGFGGYILDGWGGIHRFELGSLNPDVDPIPPSIATGGPYWQGWDIGRGLVLLADNPFTPVNENRRGGYVLDGWGGVHRFRTDSAAFPPSVTATGYWPGWDIARGIVLRGDDPTTSPANEVNSGGFVLDGFGGLHRFTTPGFDFMPHPCSTGYRQGDAARGIVKTTG